LRENAAFGGMVDAFFLGFWPESTLASSLLKEKADRVDSADKVPVVRGLSARTQTKPAEVYEERT
jgi:hypothetical protein